MTVNLERVAKQVGIPLPQVERTVALLDAGNTVSFITRFRKDQTGGLDEPQIARVSACVGKLRLLEERKGTILRSVESQGRLTPDLALQIASADNRKRLEDLYFPFRLRRQPLAEQARQRGLEALAEEILVADPACADRNQRAGVFVDPERGVSSLAVALEGAGHILADRFSQRADFRQKVRRTFRRTARLVTRLAKATENQGKLFADFANLSQPVLKVPPHRILAINRGERAKVLSVKIEADDAAMEQEAVALLVPLDHAHADFLRECVRDALVRLVIPSLERELRRDITERAEGQALEVFSRNLRHLLLQPPLRNCRLLAVDPGLRNGCQVAAIDEFGGVLELGVVRAVGPENRKEEARSKLAEMVSRHNLPLVATGNGAGCREFAELLDALLEQELAGCEIAHMVVNEAGASVYSTSALGREELPGYDATQRSAISIGRRLQDPLSELVKIAPASIGVGMYQHDMKGRHLQESLDAVVESCVNYVGVNLNTASPSLLRYVSGLNQLTARRLFDYRNEHGPFTSREQIKQVPGIGAATYVQAAGFLKIDGSENPLDATWIHPESYDVAASVLRKFAFTPDDIRDGRAALEISRRAAALDTAALARELEVGAHLLTDVLDALARPGRDPREALPAVVFHKGVVKLDDLREGMALTGSVLNVVDFGAFVDIGLPDSGLVHVSQLADRYVRSPYDVVAVGQRVQVWITSVDKVRRRVALTMIEPGTGQHAKVQRAKAQRPKREKKAGGAGDRRRKDGASAPAAASRRPRREEKKRQRPLAGKAKPKPRRPPPPLVPITRAMEEGREPMRTFGDLLQFHRKKTGANRAENHDDGNDETGAATAHDEEVNG